IHRRRGAGLPIRFALRPAALSPRERDDTAVRAGFIATSIRTRAGGSLKDQSVRIKAASAQGVAQTPSAFCPTSTTTRPAVVTLRNRSARISATDASRLLKPSFSAQVCPDDHSLGGKDASPRLNRPSSLPISMLTS